MPADEQQQQKAGILAAPQISKEHIGVLVAAMLVVIVLVVVMIVLWRRRQLAERRGFA
jgi:hypothetical protein